jgi:hypothetical protein
LRENEQPPILLGGRLPVLFGMSFLKVLANLRPMIRNRKIEESQYIRDIEKIMRNGQGPFTRKQLGAELSKLYPSLSTQEISLQVSCAIQDDKMINKRFRFVRTGYWDLAGK